MPRVEFERWDLPVAIAHDEYENIVLQIGAREPRRALKLYAEQWDGHSLDIAEVIRMFQHLPPTAFVSSRPSRAARLESVFRVVLDIEEIALASIPWEAILTPALGAIGDFAGGPTSGGARWAIVRRSPVRPRFATFPLSLPIRALQVNPRPHHPVPTWIYQPFGRTKPADIQQAVVAAAADVWDVPAMWPTVDVLHVDAMPPLTDPLSTATPEIPATLGWFARSTERWQTRLVVLHCETAAEGDAARRLAHALTAKGGPAVLIAQQLPGAAVIAPAFYQWFYGLLIHDNPLDAVLYQNAHRIDVALFAGAGREEALRPSNVGVSLVDLGVELSQGDFTGTLPVDTDVSLLRVSLEDTRKKWRDLEFDQHEHDGLLPLARELNRLRALGRLAPGARRGPVRDRRRARGVPPARVERFVNGSLWSEIDGRLEQLPQESALLREKEIYHLGIAIGPKDERIVTLNASALFEDVFKWTPDVEGLWVEFGVTGIDFDVIGDPVQEVWLPRQGASEPVYFAIRARKSGILHLRYALYYQQNLIQSFQLAAIVSPGRDLVTPAHAPKSGQLAQALGVAPRLAADKRYLARLEYSRTTALDRLTDQPTRALSICANDLGGRDVVTIKGADLFAQAVRVGQGTRNIVTQIRTALNEISYQTAPGGSQPQYQFGPFLAPAALQDRFDTAVTRLASAGFRLFTSLVAQSGARDALAACLAGERKVIHIAQLLREKGVPWAFVYDRAFDDQPLPAGNGLAAHGVCHAPLPPMASADSAAAQAGAAQPIPLGTTQCGTHVDCLLHPARLAARQQQGQAPYLEETVACPLRFWGFRHVIEVPPQQAEPSGPNNDSPGQGDGAGTQAAGGEHEEITRVRAVENVKLVAGLNATLDSVAHWTKLCEIRAWDDPEYDRAKLLARLRSPDIDVIYFFCHARGGEVDRAIDPPYLEFQQAGKPAGTIRPQDLYVHPVKWTHGPLIFLNACGSLGYSPDALSPFLQALVDERRAAGVLGTEVPVAEGLASEVGHLFLKRFVEGARAGDALLDVRRALLGRQNPLGLVYTLFASAELALIVSPAPAASAGGA